MPTKIHMVSDGLKVVDHQPGNATRYEVVVCRVPANALELHPVWVASVPRFGGSMLVEAECELPYDYVREKMGRSGRGGQFGDIDASEITKAIAMVVPGCIPFTCTDDSGNPIRDKPTAKKKRGA